MIVESYVSAEAAQQGVPAHMVSDEVMMNLALLADGDQVLLADLIRVRRGPVSDWLQQMQRARERQRAREQLTKERRMDVSSLGAEPEIDQDDDEPSSARPGQGYPAPPAAPYSSYYRKVARLRNSARTPQEREIRLTPQEREIASLIVSGYDARAIAEELSVDQAIIDHARDTLLQLVLAGKESRWSPSRWSQSRSRGIPGPEGDPVDVDVPDGH